MRDHGAEEAARHGMARSEHTNDQGNDGSDTTAAHVESETLTVDVDIPEHDPRVTTPIFSSSRKKVLAAGAVCWICGQNEQESGAPLELHHFPVERSLANLVDWALFAEQAKRGDYGPLPQAFDWVAFDPSHWETFVDDMEHNGLTLCQKHHIGKDEGIHLMPHPLWIAQRFAKEGYKFNSIEIIHHDQSN